MHAQAQFSTGVDGQALVISPTGAWTAMTLGAVDQRLATAVRAHGPGPRIVDVSGLAELDTAGALALWGVFGPSSPRDLGVVLRGDHPTAQRLLTLVAHTLPAENIVLPKQGPGLTALLERLGVGAVRFVDSVVASFSFFGHLLVTLGRVIARPSRFRLTAAVRVMEDVGVNALPIVCVLSFFVGAVVAYLGANILQAQLGSAQLASPLVGFAVVREFGVVITAILLAGRSDSAFTAQIGAMGMQQEIDAMRAMGIDPVEALVIPRVVACIAMLPLLAFGAILAGITGGMLALWVSAGVSPTLFFSLIADAVRVQDFWAGMAKAPAFALVIAIIGCRHGMQVRGDVESLGHHVTASVVQSIFAVIVLDAIFALVFLELGI